MKKMRKMVSLALTAAMTAGLMTGMGAMTASADNQKSKTALSRQRENKNHCVVKRNGIIRAVFDF